MGSWATALLSPAQFTPSTSLFQTSAPPSRAGARSDFALNLERLQHAAPALRALRLNGLCGAYAWSFNAAPGQVCGV